MANFTSNQSRSSFAWPILSALLIGSVLACLIYGLLSYGVLEQPTLKRYCLSHPTAMVAVWLCIVSLVGIGYKMQSTLAQLRILRSIDRMLDKMIVEGDDVVPSQRALWLEARWLAVPSWQQDSWTGRRIADVIDRQIRRSGQVMLDNDLRDVALAAERQQQHSLGLIRTATFVLPVLGLIGSLMCLSKVLVQLKRSASRASLYSWDWARGSAAVCGPGLHDSAPIGPPCCGSNRFEFAFSDG